MYECFRHGMPRGVLDPRREGSAAHAYGRIDGRSRRLKGSSTKSADARLARRPWIRTTCSCTAGSKVRTAGSIGQTTCGAPTTPGSNSSSKWTRLSTDLGRTTSPTPSVSRTPSGRRRTAWPSWSGSLVAKNKVESEPTKAGTAKPDEAADDGVGSLPRFGRRPAC